ncbi:adenylate/guanylate cyclase domain-containing protein [Microbacterium sp. NPDC003461]
MVVELFGLLESLHARTTETFSRQPAVVDKDGSFDVEKLPIGPTWHRLSDVVAVVFDLKSSTNLEKGRTPASTASIYDAGVSGVVKVLTGIGADFVDIQGDGGFGLFWGRLPYERALCAAITIRTFSDDFTEQLRSKWPEAPDTGFKVGVASGPVLAKRVGLPRKLNFQEPVWAGRPVNYAAKAAQQTVPGRILVTGSVWDMIEDNDYLTFSCGCDDGLPSENGPQMLWSSATIDKIPDDEKFGQMVSSNWCDVHGEQFLNTILAGERRRTEIAYQERSKRNLLASGSVEAIGAAKAREGYRIEAREALRPGGIRG